MNHDFTWKTYDGPRICAHCGCKLTLDTLGETFTDWVRGVRGLYCKTHAYGFRPRNLGVATAPEGPTLRGETAGELSVETA